MTFTGIESSLTKFGLSANAIDTIIAAGLDSDEACRDIVDVRSGKLTAFSLLEICLKGAEGEDVIAGWREYVGMIVNFAGEKE